MREAARREPVGLARAFLKRSGRATDVAVHARIPRLASTMPAARVTPRLADPTAATFRTRPKIERHRTPPQMIVADAEREHWKRKPAPAMARAKDAIVFQRLDIDYVISEPHAMLGPKRKAMGPAAMLRIFGVTAGLEHLRVRARARLRAVLLRQGARLGVDGMCEGFRKNLNEVVSQQQRGGGPNRSAVFISAVEVVRGKQSLMYYQEGKTSTVVKITWTLPEPGRDGCRGILEKQGLHVPGLHHAALCFQTFESNVLYTLRFMVDRGVVGGNWVELPAGGYAHREKKQSMCQYECDVRYDLARWYRTRQRASTASSRRSAFCRVDIECAGARRPSPRGRARPLIQIATMVTCQGDDKPAIRAIWTLDTCASPSSGRTCLSTKKTSATWAAVVGSSSAAPTPTCSSGTTS